MLRLRAQDGQGRLAQNAAAHEEAGAQCQRRDDRQGRQHGPKWWRKVCLKNEGRQRPG